MAKFIIKGKVKYNGINYNNGEVVEVAEKDINEFKAFGWQLVEDKKEVKETEEQVKKPVKKQSKKTTK